MRLAAAVLLVSLVSLAVATLVGLSSGSGLGRDIYQTRLTTLRAAGASDVAGVLQSTRSATEALARLWPEAVAATRFERMRERFASRDPAVR